MTGAANERHPSDLLHLVLAVLVAGVGLFASTEGSPTFEGVDRDLFDLFSHGPHGLTAFLVELVQLLAIAVPVIGAIVLLLLRRFRALLYAVLAAVVAGGITYLVVESLVPDVPPRLAAWLRTEGVVTGYAFPDTPFLASAMAVITVLVPWMNRSWRRLAWTVFALAVLARILGGTTRGADLVFSLGVGWAVGSLVLYVFGSPSWKPQRDDVLAAMARAGVPCSELAPDGFRARDAMPWVGTTSDGVPAYVKVMGRDERTTDLLYRTYRFVRWKEPGDERPFSSLRRAVEHEALVTLAASEVGVDTPRFLAFADVGVRGDSFLVAYEQAEGRSLADLDTDALTDDVLCATWTQVARLQDRRIAHRDLRAANLFVRDDGSVEVTDFAFSELAAPDDLLAIDVAQVLTDTALRVGVARAVAAAARVLGSDALAAALPRLQTVVLAHDTRRALRSQRRLVHDLQDEVQRVTGVEHVEHEQLERIRPQYVLGVVALGLAIYFLYPELADLGTSLHQARDAKFGWVLAAVLLSVGTYVGATISLMGSVPRRIPAVPTTLAQVASSATNAITPAGAGGYAVNVRYLQRQGVDTTVAVTGVGLDGLSGVIVHVALLAIFLVWAGRSGFGSFHLPSTGVFIAIAVGLALVTVLVAAIPRTRHFVVSRSREATRDAVSGLRQVAANPAQLIMLLGGSFIVTSTYILCLAASVQAFGGGVGIVDLAAAYLVGAAIGGAAPTPGGLGGVEAALFAGLTVAGLPNATALSSVFLFRLATFWLPILPGWLCLKVLRSRGDL